MGKKIKVSDLKRELDKRTKRQLVDEIASLCKKFDNVSEYYSLSLFKYPGVVRNNESAVRHFSLDTSFQKW